MSIGMSLLAILEEGPSYGLGLKNEFERRTGGTWPLNAGQVYSTLRRLQRDGYVAADSSEASESQKAYTITNEGRDLLKHWFAEAAEVGPPSRDALVLKLVMVARRGMHEAARVIQAERRAAVQLLQAYTRLKRETPADGDLGWMFLLDSMIFNAEARVRWLDACEARGASTAQTDATAHVGRRDPAVRQRQEVRS
jgi:DNA-binding PadR family transcriptional regulator